jgi:hypothetical protein
MPWGFQKSPSGNFHQVSPVSTDIGSIKEHFFMSVSGLQELPFNMDLWSGDFRGRDITGYESYQQTRFNAFRKETQDITITTEEGDKITISALGTFRADYMAFDYSGSLTRQAAAAETEKMNVSSKHAFSMTVEGDLNEEEQADIEKVLSRLDEIMTDLVSGDLESVMSVAPGIIDDTETLSGLNAVLQFNERVSVEQRTVTRMTGQSLPGQGGGKLPAGSSGKGLFDTGLIAVITDKLIDIMESSTVNLDKLKGPVQGYLSNLLDQLRMERGERDMLTGLVEQLDTALNRNFQD